MKEIAKFSLKSNKNLLQILEIYIIIILQIKRKIIERGTREEKIMKTKQKTKQVILTQRYYINSISSNNSCAINISRGFNKCTI